MPTPSESPTNLPLARAFVYRFLAQAFQYPDSAGWAWLTARTTQSAFSSAVQILDRADQPPLRQTARELKTSWPPRGLAAFQDDHIAAFGHTARGRCPINEIEYGDLRADPLFQPHRLADLAAFYRAFGLELAGDATERPDHLCLELEFMSVLTAKQAWALQNPPAGQNLAVCLEAQEKFLREHLGRWAPAFARRILSELDTGPLHALAAFTLEFVLSECARFQIPPGSADLMLRPVDEASESMCASCGIGRNV